MSRWGYFSVYKCIYKNSIPDGKGYYYPVTILTDVDKNNVAFKEELFGPVFIYYLC
ncbi:aldehyde dehydrogenase family protein [Candidatus Aquarickettsia rohweri]|uniref:Aldehyde dehydrogenase family protein n=1 Tax=Candidatus Aquarickettsia rohweri TaxID=2602574 RepID=A0A3S0A4J4_9RICK|nr:aldehyde dehydrogenase family protein [Candidatus Aquarickettsia rohweri]RST61804.1 aldehyde dehydrogenase family protein [Candidatus Aquarickettsia rohweri]